MPPASRRPPSPNGAVPANADRRPNRSATQRPAAPPAPPRTHAVLYARVSSKDQEKEGFSIPAQQKLLRGYAEERGLRIVEEFVDIETAKKAGRTNFEKMLAWLKKNKATCNTILVEKTDRLYRNLKDWVTLDDLRLDIHLVKEGVLLSDESRSSEKFMHGIKVLMAKNYIDNLAEEATKGMKEKASQGIWPSKAPLGYRNCVRPDGKRGIEVDPDSAPMITKLFEEAATGNASIPLLADFANTSGLRMRKSGNKIHVSTMHRILRNPFYMGEYQWHGEWIVGTHKPLVTRVLWERVQTVIDGRYQHQRDKERLNTFAFTGLITCGHCGCALSATIHKEKYIYYKCTGFKGDCGEKYAREEVIAEQFTKALASISFSAATLQLMRDSLRSSFDDEQAYHSEAVTRLQDECTKIQKRIDQMYLDKLDGVVDADFFTRHSGEWREKQRALRHQIEDHERANQAYLDEGIMLLELAHEAPRMFAGQPPDEQRKLLGFLLLNSTWANGTLTVTWRQPFSLIAESDIARRNEGAAPEGSEATPSCLVIPTGFEPVSPR
ncbi:MAG: recombinase family protein [Pseudomonadota bacterium]|nr:recombinase family protein [Pseudomonadota bacterium]